MFLRSVITNYSWLNIGFQQSGKVQKVVSDKNNWWVYWVFGKLLDIHGLMTRFQQIWNVIGAVCSAGVTPARHSDALAHVNNLQPRRNNELVDGSSFRYNGRRELWQIIRQ